MILVNDTLLHANVFSCYSKGRVGQMQERDDLRVVFRRRDETKAVQVIVHRKYGKPRGSATCTEENPPLEYDTNTTKLLLFRIILYITSQNYNTSNS